MWIDRPFLAVGLVCAALAGTSLEAGQCGYDHCWGALTVGPLGAAGRATSKRTAPMAAEAARAACGASCDPVEVFADGCAFAAETSSGARVYEFASTRALAERRAMALCQKSGTGCRIRAWACSK